jgi:MOSC domain-containing protein YiiM
MPGRLHCEPMKLVSVNVGMPRDVEWRGQSVTTGIFKEPVAGPTTVRTLNLDGDAQADLEVHGGVDKAVYAYPLEHYEYWRREMPGVDFPVAVFGENLTVEGVLEDAAYVGDRYRIGGAELVVTQPRLPCYKLGVRFDRADMVKRFLESRRTGFYFAVAVEGDVSAGDALELVGREQETVSVADIVRLYAFEKDDFATMRAAVDVEALPESWRGHFLYRLEKAAG